MPTHEDWDAVRDDPALAARLAAYDPSDDEPQAAGAAASTDVVDLDPIGEGAAQGAPEHWSRSRERVATAAPIPVEGCPLENC